MPDQQEKEQNSYEITTTAQVERTYIVQGGDDAQAHSRLRTWLKDPEMLREGLVAEQPDRQIDSTPQRVKDTKKVQKPRAVEPKQTAGAA